MRRNKLLRKSLAVGLAAVVAAASVTVPGGALSPIAVYAEEGGEGLNQYVGADVALAENSYDADEHTVKFNAVSGKEDDTAYEFSVNGGTNWTAGDETAANGETFAIDDGVITITLIEDLSYQANSIVVRVKAIKGQRQVQEPLMEKQLK